LVRLQTKGVGRYLISTRIRLIELHAIGAQNMIKHTVQLGVPDSGLQHLDRHVGKKRKANANPLNNLRVAEPLATT
jgi:hypothetical protein